MYGVLYYTVQLCRAAISMLVFFTSVSQCETDCKYNFRAFSAVFIRFTILSVGRKQVTLLQLLKQVTLLFFESLRSEQDSYAPIFSMYVTVAQRTREDVKYFRGELYSFFCNYLEYHLLSWGSNLRNLFVNTFIYHHYFHLGQSVQKWTKILVHSWILCPICLCHRDTGILRWGNDTTESTCSAKTKFQSETFSRDYIR